MFYSEGLIFEICTFKVDKGWFINVQISCMVSFFKKRIDDRLLITVVNCQATQKQNWDRSLTQIFGNIMEMTNEKSNLRRTNRRRIETPKLQFYKVPIFVQSIKKIIKLPGYFWIYVLDALIFHCFPIKHRMTSDLVIFNTRLKSMTIFLINWSYHNCKLHFKKWTFVVYKYINIIIHLFLYNRLHKKAHRQMEYIFKMEFISYLYFRYVIYQVVNCPIRYHYWTISRKLEFIDCESKSKDDKVMVWVI